MENFTSLVGIINTTVFKTESIFTGLGLGKLIYFIYLGFNSIYSSFFFTKLRTWSPLRSIYRCQGRSIIAVNQHKKSVYTKPVDIVAYFPTVYYYSFFDKVNSYFDSIFGVCMSQV